MKKQKTISLKIFVIEKIERMAKEENRTFSKQVECILTRYIEIKEMKEKRRKKMRDYVPYQFSPKP